MGTVDIYINPSNSRLDICSPDGETATLMTQSELDELTETCVLATEMDLDRFAYECEFNPVSALLINSVHTITGSHQLIFNQVYWSLGLISMVRSLL